MDPLSIICARISASLTAEGDVSPEAPPAAFAGMAQVGISELPTLKRVTRETPSPPPLRPVWEEAVTCPPLTTR